MKKGDSIWISYVIWVAFIIGVMAFVTHQALPILENLQFSKEVKKASNLLLKIKDDVELFRYSAYGSELKYYLDFKDGYLVCNQNSSKLELWLKVKGKGFNKNWVSKGVNAKVDYDFLILSVDLGEKILNDLSAKAEGFFYVRNKGVGVVITDKNGMPVFVNKSIKPLNPYFSWVYNASFYYKGLKWEDIWLDLKDNNSFVNKEIYAFEVLNKSVLLNYSGFNENKSGIVKVGENLTTDFGNYWSGEDYLEVPFNRRVNVSFVFDNVISAGLILNFEYLGKKITIKCKGEGNDVECSPNSVILSYFISPIIAQGKHAKIGIKNYFFFYFYNLPTYTNYSIDWSYVTINPTTGAIETSSGTTWRVFTPFI